MTKFITVGYVVKRKVFNLLINVNNIAHIDYSTNELVLVTPLKDGTNVLKLVEADVPKITRQLSML